MDSEAQASTPPTEPRGSGDLRWNPLTLRWVAIAPVRASRPVEPDGAESAAGRDGGGGEGACPFCPGNERELPGILLELPDESGSVWSFRAVPNRFAAFREEVGGDEVGAAVVGGDEPGGAEAGRRGMRGAEAGRTEGPREAPEAPSRGAPRPARGRQEVLIESPEHLDDLSTMDAPALARMVEGYHARYAQMAARPELARVFLFRNRGRNAGNSLRHPHAQLVGVAFDPPEARARDAAFRRLSLEASGSCPLCEPQGFEPNFRDRLVRRTRHFSCWVPWAAEAPFEVWIAPRRHVPDFRDSARPDERRELAELLGWVARRYRDAAGDPDYNLLLHSVGPRDPDPRELHWWIRFVPRIGKAAGLELLSGLRVNPSSPEEDAARLAGNSTPPPA